MSKELLKNEEVEAIEVETTEVKESKFKKVMTRVGGGIKHHGKKIAVAAAVGTVGLIGYSLGKKRNDGDDETCDEVETDNFELFEMDNSEVENTEE